jgi:hypothetical protein
MTTKEAMMCKNVGKILYLNSKEFWASQSLTNQANGDLLLAEADKDWEEELSYWERENAYEDLLFFL